MASDDSVDDSCEQRMMLDEGADAEVRRVNSLFPKIDNLEHFPLKVLLNIFEYVDDIGLLNLAIESYRFESIAKIVLNGRYRTNYFDVDDTTKDVEMISDFFDRFGKEIRAINAKTAKPIHEDHWMAFALDKASNLRRLALDIDGVEPTNEQFLQRHVNSEITHLTIDLHTDSRKLIQFVPPDFRNLKLLVIGDYPVFSFESLKELIRDNPGLESLGIGARSSSYIASAYPFHQLLEHIGTCEMQLNDFSYVNRQYETYYEEIRSAPDHIIAHFVNALKHLESLTLTGDLFTDTDVLLHRLSSGCTRIKHMQIFCTRQTFYSVPMLNALKRFGNLQSLKLTETYSLEPHMIVPVVEHLPLLKDLQFELNHKVLGYRLWVFLSLLEKCPSLQNITVLCYIPNKRLTYFADIKTFSKFIGTFIGHFIGIVQQRNVKIQIKDPWKTVCSFSNNEVIFKDTVIMHLAKPTDS